MREEIIRVLNSMIKGEIKVIPYVGICYNVFHNMTNHNNEYTLACHEVISELSLDWKHHSGSYSSPVPSPREHGNQELWKGEQKALRISLMKHIVKKLTNISDYDFNEMFLKES